MQPGGDWAHAACARRHLAAMLSRITPERSPELRPALGAPGVGALEDRQDDGAQAGQDDQELEDAAGNRHGAEQAQDEQANQQRCVDFAVPLRADAAEDPAPTQVSDDRLAQVAQGEQDGDGRQAQGGETGQQGQDRQGAQAQQAEDHRDQDDHAERHQPGDRQRRPGRPNPAPGWAAGVTAASRPGP